jgi:myo-inositol-1(or 4)-monophosphatase
MGFPVVAAGSQKQLERLAPWGESLLKS